MQIRIRAAASSDVGRHRRLNEDAFGFDLDRGLFIVCDGVGGTSAGEIASRTAVDCVLSRFPREVYDSHAGGSELQRAIQHANRAVYQATLRDPVYQGMCTTILVAHFDGARMWIGHVGDSRAYLLRQQSIHRLTDDHSRLQQMLLDEKRQVSGQEAAYWDSILTQALGGSDMVLPAITRVQVELGDCFILATDGISKAISQNEMLAMLRTAVNPEQACQLLIDAANDAGGYDNATCIVVEID